MIKLEILANIINAILGTDKFVVFFNSNAYPDDTDNRTVVTMNALRVPFGFSTEEFDAESLTVTLTFDLPCDVLGHDADVRYNALDVIETQLLGRKKYEYKQFEGTDNEEKYIINTFFEQQPTSNPYVDSGRITQQIVLSGKVLVQSETCGAVVGNDVIVSLKKEEDTTYTQLLKSTRASSAQIGAENNLKLSEEKTLPEMFGISRINTKTLNFIYTGKEIEKEFLKIAEGISFDVNCIYDYKVSYPSFDLVQKIKIVNVSTEDAAGVYLQYTLTVQAVGDATEV